MIACPRCTSPDVFSHLVGQGKDVQRLHKCHRCGFIETVGELDGWQLLRQAKGHACTMCERPLRQGNTATVCQRCKSKTQRSARPDYNRHHVRVCLMCEQTRKMQAHRRICEQCRKTEDYLSASYAGAA